MEEQAKKSVLFISIHNATRSQMAEGLLKHFRGDRFEAFSAGVEPLPVDETTILVMKEVEIDISRNESKPIEYFNGKQFDYAITICSSASEARPEYPQATTKLSWDIADPSLVKGTEQEKLDEYRKIRDSILQQIRIDLL